MSLVHKHMLSYVEQSSDELKLFVGTNIFSPQNHTIIQKSSFSTAEFLVKFGILAESHYVSIHNGTFSVDELCICTDVIIPGIEPQNLHEIKGTNLKFEDESYVHNFNAVYIKGDESLTRHKALLENKTKHSVYYLEHVFPCNEKGQENAMTAVYVTVGIDILIESVHTYPNENTAVFTQSRITFK